jgi:hypothetical protein
MNRIVKRKASLFQKIKNLSFTKKHRSERIKRQNEAILKSLEEMIDQTLDNSQDSN